MIVYKKCDLFTDLKKGDVVIHNTNCFNTWGSGFAKTAAKYMPELKALDFASTKGDFQKLGTFISADEGLITSVAVYGQYTYSRERKVLVNEKLAAALRLVNKELLKPKAKLHVKLPKIGGGLAGGNWNDIENIINGTLTNAKSITVYEH